MIKVKRNWWKNYFNGIYLITDARSVCDEGLTKREVDLVEKLLNLKKDDRILDLFGGQGRHSLELAGRDYRDLTVLDYSKYLVSEGKKTAERHNKTVKFHRGDARSTGLKSESYTVLLIMANSFGYFDEENDDVRVLKEARRLMEDGGRILLDLTDADYARKNLTPASRHDAGSDISIFRTREIENDTIKAREIVISGTRGLLRDGTYSERLYTDEKIKALLENAGYKDISIHKGVSLHKEKKDYGFLTSRMMVTAIK